MKIPREPTELLTTRDAAAILKMSQRTVVRAVKTGQLAGICLGRNIRVFREAVSAPPSTAPQN